jgi:hypothetical protein
VRLALIGAGRHGQRYLKPENGLVRNLPVERGPLPEPAVGGFPERPASRRNISWREGDPEVVAICSNEHETAELLRNPERADAAIVATRAPSHAALAIKLLRAGLHVLVEKPAALTFDDVCAMTDTADREKRTLLVAHTRLFGGSVVAPLPEVAELEYTIGGPRPARDMQEVPALVDWGCHAVSWALASCWPRKLTAFPIDGETWRVSSAGGYLLSLHGGGASVTLHCGDFRERVNSGEYCGRVTRLWEMVHAFSRACRGEPDFRASTEFTRAVYRLVLP